MAELEVALTRCFFCCEGNEIILNSLLTSRAAAQVKALHDKVINTRPCPTCEGFMKQGIVLITFDEAKSGKDWNKGEIPNPYRTGGFFVVKESFVERVFDSEKALEFAKKHRWLFIEHEAAVRIGLFEAGKVK